MFFIRFVFKLRKLEIENLEFVQVNYIDEEGESVLNLLDFVVLGNKGFLNVSCVRKWI